MARRQQNRWSRKLPRIVVTSDGFTLGTLAEASAYMLTLPEGIQLRPYWQHAAKLVMEAAGGGDITAATDQIALALLLDGRLNLRATPVSEK